MMSVEPRFRVSKMARANGKSMISQRRRDPSDNSPRFNVDVG